MGVWGVSARVGWWGGRGGEFAIWKEKRAHVMSRPDFYFKTNKKKRKTKTIS